MGLFGRAPVLAADIEILPVNALVGWLCERPPVLSDGQVSAALLATPWYSCAPWPQVITSAMGAYQGDGLPCPELAPDAFADTPERYQTL